MTVGATLPSSLGSQLSGYCSEFIAGNWAVIMRFIDLPSTVRSNMFQAQGMSARKPILADARPPVEGPFAFSR
jgi:hypothetical protein